MIFFFTIASWKLNAGRMWVWVLSVHMPGLCQLWSAGLEHHAFQLCPVISAAGSLGTTFSRIPFKQESSQIPPMRGLLRPGRQKISTSQSLLQQQQGHLNLPALLPPLPDSPSASSSSRPQAAVVASSAGSSRFCQFPGFWTAPPPNSFCTPQLYQQCCKHLIPSLLERSWLAHASCTRLGGGGGTIPGCSLLL